jgi:hypothetical protein
VGGFPLVGILLGAFAICLTAMWIAGWRERRRLGRPLSPPVIAVVDEGRLRFGPATDGLIRGICAMGGRRRLEAAFDWGDGRSEPLPHDEFVGRLQAMREGLVGMGRSLPVEGDPGSRFT